jgi:hypothetical protein
MHDLLQITLSLLACRCLVCDRSLMDRSASPPQTAPAAASSGRSSSPLPLFEQFRPATAAACSSSRCSAGLGPLGPGLNAAQLRKMAEARLQGGSVSSSLAHIVDAAEAAQLSSAGCSELGEGIGAAAGQAAAAGPGYHMPCSSPSPNRAARQATAGRNQQQQLRPHTAGSALAGLVHGNAAAAAAAASVGVRPSTSSTQRGPRIGQQQTGGSNGRRTPVFV